MDISIISASAGSGKTTELSRVLADALLNENARPEAVVATTFTNKAAAELRERVRAKLLENEHVELAQRLTAARMGTVHSVCGQLVADFADELGISPNLRVIDETQASAALGRARSGAITPERRKRLAELKERMAGLEWEKAVENIVTLARTNGIDEVQLRSFADASRSSFLALLGEAAPEWSADRIDQALLDALQNFPEQVHPDDDTTGTQNTLKRTNADLRQLSRSGWIPWKEWVYLTILREVRAQSREAAEALKKVAARFDIHPELQQQAGEVIDLVFDIAADSLHEYERYKRDLGVLDFTDQETLALRLLQDDAVKAVLKEEIDLVLVDEFQDTSPIQLHIFSALASLAKRCVWVGDQKQAIYGFRGTDPALMDVALAAVEGSGGCEPLEFSWRSRPELVELTSAVFVQAFARYDFPEERVRLSAKRTGDGGDLGHIVEYWELDSKNKPDDAKAIAAGVAELLRDDEARVEDRRTGQSRSAAYGDIAVLCRKNDTCRSVAEALEDRGIPSVVERPGLMRTPEAVIALAALRLWVDARDSLAAEEIVRVVEYPDQPDEWLRQVLKATDDMAASGERDEREEYARVRAITQAATAGRLLGPVEAFDASIAAVGLRELCARWGDVEQRIANIDALRAKAVTYVQEAGATGTGATPAGLVAHLVDLRDDNDLEDFCAPRPGGQAVTVSTWHGAKGLEWPITVLMDLDWEGDSSALGVHVVSEQTTFDFANPLAGRSIRFWPQPFDPAQKHYPFYDRLHEAPESIEIANADRREQLRLLYMCWTRARDRLVLAARPKKLLSGMLGLLVDEDGQQLIQVPGEDNGQVEWAGVPVDVKCRAVKPDPAGHAAEKTHEWYHVPGPRTHPPAFVQPSALDASGPTGEPIPVGERLPLSGQPDMADLGDAVHAFLAADDIDLEQSERLAMAERLLQNWGVASALPARSLLQAADALAVWVSSTFPDGTIYREWPLLHRLETGSVVRGEADMIVETPEGYYIIDHKSYPGGREQAIEHAASFAGQLAAYAEAIAAATGKDVLGCFIHLPISGLVVPVQVPIQE